MEWLIITGLKWSGKFYLLFNIFYNYLKENGVNSKHIITLALDDLQNQKFWDPNELYKYISDQNF